MDLDSLNKLKERMTQIGQLGVYIGITGKYNILRDKKLNQAALAATHELGESSQNIPQRSFLRSAVLENKTQCAFVMKEQLKAIVDGKISTEKALDKVGLKITKLVHQKINKGAFVPLKPVTIARKKSSRPLIETGSLKKSISHEVKK